MSAASVMERPEDLMGLTPEEYDRAVAILGRRPTLTELGVFSVMWSEHCSYKSSRQYLKSLPTEGPHVLQGPGETPGWSISAMVWQWHSRWKATTIHLLSNHIRGLLPGSVVFCGTFLPWAPGPSPH